LDEFLNNKKFDIYDLSYFDMPLVVDAELVKQAARFEDPLIQASYNICTEALAADGLGEPKTEFATHTMEGILFGVHYEDRQEELADKEKLAHMLANDAYFGLSSLGFP